MTWRRGALLFFAALAGALIPLIPTVQVAGALTAPIELAGGLLRELSLSGPGGNVLAWAIVLLAAGLPLLLLVLPPNRGRRHWGAASEPGAAALGGHFSACQLPAPDRSGLLRSQPQLSEW